MPAEKPDTTISKRILTLLLLSLLVTVLSNCAGVSNSTVSKLFKKEKNVIDIAYTIAEELDRRAYPPLVMRHPDKPILQTTYVNTDNLQETSHFGRIVQENIASRFVQMGYTVREVKMRKDLNIEEKQGEMILSRRLEEIRPSQAAQAISVGTYALTGNIMYINAKLIEPENGNIISAVDMKLQLDDNLLAMFGLEHHKENDIEAIAEPRSSLMTRLLY